jgi:hypothetical protein
MKTYLEPKTNWTETAIPADVLARAEAFLTQERSAGYVAHSIEHAYAHGYDSNVSGTDTWILHYSDARHAEWNQPL